MSTFADYIDKPQSKKITIVEMDVPLTVTWINYQPGIWVATMYSDTINVTDDNGNTGYYTYHVDSVPNINSLNVNGTLYSEQTSLANCISTEKSWYYDTSEHKVYAHFEDWHTPDYYNTVAPGAVLGFTNQVDTTCNNYFEDIYYEPRVTSIPNMTKKKDSLFFGILQYQGGTISFDNIDGYFDDFAQRDLYGQPVRIYLSFEGLAYSEAKKVYTGKVKDFVQDFASFQVQVMDKREFLSRKLPVNVFNSTDYPSMDSKLLGIPIPIIFGSVIGVPAYRTSAGNWKFADTTYNSIDSSITVYKEDGTSFTAGGTITDGTFTGTDTTDKLYVDCTQSSVQNGLDIIADILENYEGIAFNSSNYDTLEWTSEKADVMNEGIWIGKGNLMTSVDVIEQVCTDNQGVFDVLADGRFTFRTFDEDRTPTFEILEDELLDDPVNVNSAEEYLSSVKIEYNKDWLNDEYQLYTDSTKQSEVYGRYRQYKERTFTTCLMSEANAVTLASDIMSQSKIIKPILGIKTKTQNVEMKILDNILFKLSRQNGSIIIDRSRYQVLGIDLDLMNYEMGITIKQIEEDSNIYAIFDGGTSTTDYDYYDGGDSTTNYNVIDGGAA